MKIALFLGAGASTPFGKPVTAEFKDKLLEKYHSLSTPYFFMEFLRCDKFQDIEQVLQSIKDIKKFLDSHGGQFLASSYTPLFINYGGNHHQFNQEFFNKEIDKIEKIIHSEIFNYYRWEPKFNEELLKIYNSLFSIFDSNVNAVNVFTTNYDSSIEEYCGLTQNHKCIDGFQFNIRKRRLLWAKGNYVPPDNDMGIDVYLYKLHGSLNWKRHTAHEIERTTEESQPTDSNYLHNVLIYPTLSPKEEENDEPYKTIIDKFENYMKSSDVCIVIGYSFRDHLNYVFEEFVERGKTLIIVSPTAVADFCKNVLKKEELTEKERVAWSNPDLGFFEKTTNNGKTAKIYRIQKKLTANTVREIVHDIKKILDPDKHPF